MSHGWCRITLRNSAARPSRRTNDMSNLHFMKARVLQFEAACCSKSTLGRKETGRARMRSMRQPRPGKEPPMSTLTIAVDLAKNVFELAIANDNGTIQKRKRL